MLWWQVILPDGPPSPGGGGAEAGGGGGDARRLALKCGEVALLRERNERARREVERLAGMHREALSEREARPPPLPPPLPTSPHCGLCVCDG
jgi:hypothetical protein